MSCVRGCCETQAEHYRNIVVRATTCAEARQEKTLAADLDAYKRLRESGAKPKTFEGAATLEREAHSSIEIERNHIIRNDRLRREVEQAHKDAPPPPSAA